MSPETAFVECPECHRSEVELPAVGSHAAGICPGCYANLSVPVFRCGRCGDLVGITSRSKRDPELCFACAGED